MKRKNYLLGFGLLVMFVCTCANSALALNASDCTSYTSNVAPTTNGTTTTVTTTHNIDSYNWSRYNLNPNETAFYQFTANGQTAVNYVNPGAEASMIRGAITGSSNYTGNVLIFNPNGMTITTGAKINNLNTFTASTNRYDGVSGNNVLFSQVSNPKALKVDDVSFNNVNNAHFIAPGIIFNANNANPKNEISFRAIGGGSFNVTNNTFSNEVAITTPALETDRYIMDIGGSFKANKITVESKANYAGNTDVIFSSNAEANAIVTDGKSTNGSVYLLAENQNKSDKANAEIFVNGKISGNGADVSVKANRVVLNGNIDTSGANGGSVDIKSDYLDQYGKISANGQLGAGGNINIWTKGDYVATNEATVSATGLTKGGNISVQGDYQILTSAKYDASSSSGKGGTVKISAPLTKLYGTNINTSGKTAGGEVYIGGPGKTKTSIVSSEMTIVNDGSTIDASSTNGKGGTVVIDSAGTTDAFGMINTKGYGLNGGNIELSGALGLQINTKNVNTGLGGTILLDPKNIYISDEQIGNIAYVRLFQMDSDRKTALGLSRQDFFGSAIALYDNLMAVGAYNTGSAHQGAAYLFYFEKGTPYDSLTLYKKLADGIVINGPNGTTLNLNLSSNEFFGSGIALTDKLLAIGASGQGTSGYSVYLWDFAATPTDAYAALKLDGIIRKDNDKKTAFGSSVALKEYTKSDSSKYEMLAVGAEGSDANYSGSEYLYQFTYVDPTNPYNGLSLAATPTTITTPTPTITLNGTTPTAADMFGSGSALSTIKGIDNKDYGILAVGADGDSAPGGIGGLVHLYQFDINTPDQAHTSLKLTINESALGLTTKAGDMLGSSVALSLIQNPVDSLYYELLAIGSQGYDGGITNSGAVYLTHIDNNKPLTPYKLTNDATVTVNPSSTATGDNLGSAVALGYTSTIATGSDGLLAMGAEQNSTSSYPNSGAIYLYTFTPNTIYTGLKQEYKIDASSTVNGHAQLRANDNFGCSTALWNNLLAVGASGDDTGAENAGAVYLYGFDFGTIYKNLTLYKKLASGRSVLDKNGQTYTITLSEKDLYGSSVSLYNNLLAVGAPGTNSNAGAAYLYNFNTGTPYTALTYQGKIYNSSIGDNILLIVPYVAGDKFGSAVSLFNNLLAVGASGDDTAGTNAGAVDLFHFTPTASAPYAGITFDTKLATGIGLAPGDAFGSAVALYTNSSANALAVGAPYTKEGSSTTGAGAAYLFTFVSDGTTNPYHTITKQKEIQSGTASQYTLHQDDHFGSSVALNRDIFAIGAPGTDSTVHSRSDTGGVYFYTIPNNQYNNPLYSQALVDGTSVFDYSAPVGPTPSINLDLQANGQFGSAVSIFDSYLVVGAQGYTSGTVSNAGAIYLMCFRGGMGQGYLFTDFPTEDMYLSTQTLADWLAISNVILQANNDIIFKNSVAVTSGTNYMLSLESGRDTIIQAGVNVDLGSSNLVAVTNQNAFGTTLVNANRDSGNADFDMESGSSLKTTGDISITMNQGYTSDPNLPSPTHNTSGNINLTTVEGRTVAISNHGLDNITNSNVIFNGNVTTGAGGLSANSDNSSITQNAGTTITLNGGGSETLTTPKGNINLLSSTTGSGGTIGMTAGGDVNIGDAAQTSTVNIATGGGALTISGENVNINANSGSTPQTTTIDAGSGAVNITANAGTATTDSQLYMSDKTSIKGGAVTLTLNDDGLTTSKGTITLNDVEGTSVSAINNEMGVGTLATGSNLVLNGIINATNPAGASTFKAAAGSVKESTSASTITAQGTTTLSAGTAYDIELLSANDFVGQVMIPSGKSAYLNDISGIIMGTSTLGNDLVITAGGDITEFGGSAITVGRDTKLYTSGIVSLNQADNDFCSGSGLNGQVYIGTDATHRAASGTIVDKNALALGDIFVNTDLNLTAGGAITQCDGKRIIAGGVTTLLARSADTLTKYDITLNNPNNDFGTVTTIAGNTVTLNDVNSILIGNSDVYGPAATGGLIVTAGNSITTNGYIKGYNDGAVTLTATAGNINVKNNITTNAGALNLTGQNVYIGDTAQGAALAINTNNGAIKIDAKKDVVIQGNTTDNTKGTSIAAGTGNIDITANDSTGATSSHLSMTANSSISSTGIVSLLLKDDTTSANGIMTINDVTGGSVSIKNQEASNGSTIQIDGNVNATNTLGNLEISTVQGDIEQNPSTSSVKSTGTTTLAAGSGNNLYDITLESPTNDFTGAVSVNAGKDVKITDATSLLMGQSTIGSPTVTGYLNLKTIGGGISQNGTLTVNGTTDLAAGSGVNLYDITLDTATNDFTDTVSISAGKIVKIADANDLRIGTSTIGNIAIPTTQSELDLTAWNGGAITQNGVIEVFGTTHLQAGSGTPVDTNDITLDLGNNFHDQVYVISANNAKIHDIDDLSFGTSNVAKNFTLTAGGNISECANQTVTVGKDFVITAAGSNTFSQKHDAAINLTTGNLTITANGGISQDSGASIVVAKDTHLNTTGAIDLNQSNDFGSGIGQLYIASNSAHATSAIINSINALALGNVFVNNALTITAGGNLTQCGAPSGTKIIAGGTTTLKAQKGSTYYDIVLENTDNDFNIVKITAANSAKIHDVNSIEIGNSNVFENSPNIALNVTAGNSITTSGNIIGNGSGSINLSATGNVSVKNNITTNAGALNLTGQDVYIGDPAQGAALAINTQGGAIKIDSKKDVKIQGNTIDNTKGTTISSGAGNIDIIANDSTGSGNSQLSMTTNSAITSSGIVSLLLKDDTTSAIGTMTINDVTGGSVLINNQQTSDDSTIQINGNFNATNSSGNLTISTAQGYIHQTASTNSIKSSGTTTLAAGSGSNLYDIKLNNTTNDFTGAVSVNAGKEVEIVDANNLEMGTSTIGAGSPTPVTGKLTLTALNNGGITQSGILTVYGETHLQAGDGTNIQNNIDLTLQNLFYDQVYITHAYNASITDADNLAMGNVNVKNQLNLVAGGNITQCDNTSIVTGGDAHFDAGGTIDLDNPGNNFGNGTGQIYIGNSATDRAGSATIVTSGALALGDIYVTGALNLTAGGDITQCGGKVVMDNGITTLKAQSSSPTTNHNITLTNANNDFNTVVITAGQNVSLRDINDIIMGASTVSGNLAITTDAGTITQSGALSVAGTTALAAGSGLNLFDITLDTATNDFGGAVSVSAGNNVKISDANNLTMGSVTTGGNLTLKAGQVSPNTGNISLANTTVHGNMDLLATNGNITQSGSPDKISVTGTSNLQANTTSSNYIKLDNSLNDFGGAVSVKAGDYATIYDANSLAMGTVTTGGDLTLKAGQVASNTGDISLANTTVGGDMDLLATNGNITQSYSPDKILVTGATNLNAATAGKYILLDNNLNDFGGAVTVTAGDYATIYDANSLAMGSVTTGGNLTLKAGQVATNTGDISLANTNVHGNMDLLATNGNITQSYSTDKILVTGTSNLSAATAGKHILLDNAANDFSGDVSVNAGDYATIYDATDLAMGTVSTGGNLTLKAGQGVSGTGSISLANTTVNGDMDLLAPNGNITQITTGTGVTVLGTTKLSAGTGSTNKIELTNESNSFHGAITIASAYDASITNSRSIWMATSKVDHNLTLKTMPSILSGIYQLPLSKLQVGHDTHLISTGVIDLSNDLNDFCQDNVGQVYISEFLAPALSAKITDVDDLIMGDTHVLGDLTLTANGDLSQCSLTSIIVGGNVNLNIKGDIDLGKSGNRLGYLGGQLYIGDSGHFADSASIVNSEALKLGDIYVTGNLNLTAGGNITQCEDKVVIDNATTTLKAEDLLHYYDITLENTGNDFNTVKITSANSAKIHDVDDITIGTSNVYGNSPVDALKVTAGTDIFTSGNITGNGSGTVTLSANRDTTVTNNITTNAGKIALAAGHDLTIGPAGTSSLSIASGGGLITVDANHSVNINGNASHTTNISSSGNDITITANKTNAETGAVINMTPYTTINGGTNGNVTLTLASTGLGNGAITVNNIIGKAVTVHNQGTAPSGSDVIINGNITSNGGTGLTVTSDKGDITQNEGSFISLNSGSPANLTATVGTVNIYGSTTGTNGAVGVTAGNNINIGKAAQATPISITTGGGQLALDAGNNVNIGAAGQTAPVTIASNGGVINIDAGKNVEIIGTASGATSIASTSVSNNGAINITANETPSAGNSEINMTPYTSIDAGPATVTIALNNDSNPTTTGQIILNDVTGGSVSVTNNKATANSDILLNGIISSINPLAAGRLTLSAANGTITQGTNSTVLVQNDTYLNTPTTVTLTNTGNDFCQNGTGQVYIGNTTTPVTTASIYDKNNLIMGNTYTSGALNLTSVGNITQCAPTSINVGGTTTLNAGGGNITLANSTNDFAGSVVFSNAADVSLADANNLDIGASSNTGTFTASAGQDLLINGVLDLGNTTTLSANRSININQNITVENGGFTATANNGPHTAGTLGNFAMAGGTTINVPRGEINITIPNNTDAGSITLSNLIGTAITAWDQSLTAGTNVIINPQSTITSTGTTANPLVLCSDGGDFINNSGATALVTATGQRWLVYSGSPATTTLGGISPIVNTLYSSTIYTVPPTSVAAGNSVLYRTPAPVTPPTPTTGPGAIIAGGVTGGAAAGGALAASLSPLLLAGLTPNSIIAASPMYLLDLPEITGAAAPITGPAAPIYEGAKKYQFYYDKDKNIIIWVNPEEAPALRK